MGSGEQNSLELRIAELEKQLEDAKKGLTQSETKSVKEDLQKSSTIMDMLRKGGGMISISLDDDEVKYLNNSSKSIDSIPENTEEYMESMDRDTLEETMGVSTFDDIVDENGKVHKVHNLKIHTFIPKASDNEIKSIIKEGIVKYYTNLNISTSSGGYNECVFTKLDAAKHNFRLTYQEGRDFTTMPKLPPNFLKLFDEVVRDMER